MPNIDVVKEIYQNSSLPELVPVGVKRAVKKVIKPGSDALGVSYRNAEWMIKRTGYGKEKVRRSGYRRIKSDTIEIVTTYANRARRTEEEINKILKKRYYRFEHMMVLKDPYYQVPLSAVVIFYTKEPCGVRYTVKGKTKKADFSAILAPCSDHLVPVLGLYADYDNKVLIELLDNAGKAIKSRTITIRMRPLPGILLDVIKVGKHSADSAHPLTMISGGHDIRTVVFDEFGDVRFFLRRLT
ncbi:MAG: arylsulfate sulfotransferase N-terminal domain-containing protein, partial [Lachnospiraceae bacterium]|nr:arylsulfate sulfotransferase N-terminal domain-containing protein [Lachnospiraceae bacterium]